jgi:hypothetical protein
VNDDNVESSHRCCALVIGLMGILECRLGHSQLRGVCPPATSSFYSATRWGPTIMDRLAPPTRAQGESGSEDSVPLRWAPVGVNPTFSPLT